MSQEVCSHTTRSCSSLACLCPAVQMFHGRWGHPGDKKRGRGSLGVQTKPPLPGTPLEERNPQQGWIQSWLTAGAGLEPTALQSAPRRTPFRCPLRSPGGSAPAAVGRPPGSGSGGAGPGAVAERRAEARARGGCVPSL